MVVSVMLLRDVALESGKEEVFIIYSTPPPPPPFQDFAKQMERQDSVLNSGSRKAKKYF